MSLELYLGFVAATTILILIPGPNVALIVANSVAYGTRYGLLTVAGTSSAMVPLLALTVLGMAALLGNLAAVFEWLRWIGVAYLLYLGLQHWRAPAVDLSRATPQPRSVRAIYLRGVLVSLSNPKTLLFYGAFFPQFVTPGPDLERQLLLLAATFIVLAATLDSLWAVAAGRARHFLARSGRWRNRVTGGALIGAGIGLALARES